MPVHSSFLVFYNLLTYILRNVPYKGEETNFDAAHSEDLLDVTEYRLSSVNRQIFGSPSVETISSFMALLHSTKLFKSFRT